MSKEIGASLLINYYSTGSLPPEVDDEGNIEYKLKLINPSIERLEHLVTQMKWRLSEGNGEAFYEIGVDDDGTIKGLTNEEMESSIQTIRQMASVLSAEVTVQHQFSTHENRSVAEIVVRNRPSEKDSPQFSDLRIVIVGGLGAGKSTLLGFLSHGAKDNGRGRARLNLLRHRHELESGRSSSISHEIIGYDTDGCLMNYATTNVSTWEQICESSTKIVTFLDTCGFPKYLRTTISGIMGHAPDYACLVVAGNSGDMTDMAREHLSIAILLDLPVFVVITKSDLASTTQLRQTLRSLLSIIKSPGMSSKKLPRVIQSEEDAIACAAKFSRRGSDELPIFMVSNVKGTNLNLLTRFFYYLPKPKRMDYDELLEEPVEFQIGEVFSIPDTGDVIGGVLVQGRINIKDNKEYYLGPNAKGEFKKIKVTSIQRHRIPVHYIHCGQTATIALDNETEEWKIQKGMVLLETENPQSYFEFEVELMVLYHATGVTAGTCGMIHSGPIRQQAKVISAKLNSDSTEKVENIEMIESGQSGLCRMRFTYNPFYLKIGSQILFIEGKTKCLGRVTRLI